MNEKLYDYVNQNLTKEQILDIMDDALDLMQQYNGRTVDYCISESLRDRGLLK